MRPSWFGHTDGCPGRGHPTWGEHGEFPVCTACMPDTVPRCDICGALASLQAVSPGWRWYTFGGLCPECVARIQSAGPWKERRAAANEARVAILTERHPDLLVTRAPSGKWIRLDGVAEGRATRVTLKRSAREGELERFVLRVELRVSRAVALEDLRLPPEFLARTGALVPSVTTDDQRWLRVGFQHLGKLDILTALEGLVATAEGLEAGGIGNGA